MEKVAPWLTVDGDPYPAVVDGRVLWILDGYTTTDRFPNAERESFQEMTNDALTSSTSYVTLPTDQINYIRNSVKATVDAYTGEVTLYEWDEEDPILEAWKSVFPDAVTAARRHPRGARRAPALPRGHVQDPALHAGAVPRHLAAGLLQGHRPLAGAGGPGRDGEDAAALPALGADAAGPGPRGRGRGLRRDAEAEEAVDTADLPVEDPVFSLTSVFTPTNRQNLASFVAVNSDATDENYGQFRILRLPDSTQVQGPSQIANTFSADESIQGALLPIKQNSQILDGNLLTLPVGGGLLYVQPVYALRESGEGSYPVLQFVLASFGRNAGFGTTLTEALNDVLESGELTEEETGGTEEVGGDGGQAAATATAAATVTAVTAAAADPCRRPCWTCCSRPSTRTPRPTRP